MSTETSVCIVLLLQRKITPEEGWTVIVLKLNVTGDDYFLVKESLEQLDPQTLLFTRRLREVEFSTLSKGDKSDDGNCCQIVE